MAIKNVSVYRRLQEQKIDEEVKISASSIIVNDNGVEKTLQQAWADLLLRLSSSSDSADVVEALVYGDVAIPTQVTAQDFNDNKLVTAQLSGYQRTIMDINDNQNKLVGTHYATVTLKDNLTWEDGTKGSKQVPWTITEQKITDIPAQINLPEYTGDTLYPTLSNFSDSYFTVGEESELSGVAVRDNYIIYLTPKTGYCWEDGTQSTTAIFWSILPKEVTVPVQVNVPDYSGEEIDVEWDMENISLFFDIDGDTRSNQVGTHTVYLTPKNIAWWKDNHGRERRPVYWSIMQVGTPRVTWTSTTVSFTGLENHPDWQNVDPVLMDIRHNKISIRDVGYYTTQFVLKDGVTWVDGSTQPITCIWNKQAYNVPVPTISQTTIPTYNTYETGPSIINLTDFVTVSGDKNANAGEHTIVFSLNQEEKTKGNIVWLGRSSTSPISYSWKVNPKKISKPDISKIQARIKCAHDNDGDLIETGPTIVMPTGYQNDYQYLSITGARAKDITDTIPYTLEIKPINSNYCWLDGSSTPIRLNWSIYADDIPLPTISGTYTFNGQTQTAKFNYYKDAIEIVDNSDQAYEQGQHTTTFKLKKAGTRWQGLSGTKRTANYSLKWNMGYLYITVPEAAQEEYPYNPNGVSLLYKTGRAPDLSWVRVTNDSGDQTKNYKAVYELKDKNNTMWAGINTVQNQEIYWSITGLKNKITLSSVMGSIAGNEGSSINITATIGGSAVISAVSEDNSICVAEVTGYTTQDSNRVYNIKLTDGGKTGITTIKISGTATADYSQPVDKIFTVTVQPYRALAHCSLEDIIKVIGDNKVSDTWNIGDEGIINLKSKTVADIVIGGEYRFVYLGNNQEDGRYHFMLKDHRDDTFCSGFYSTKLRHTDGIRRTTLSWNNSTIRTYLNEIYTCFPDNWKYYFENNNGVTVKKTQQSFQVTPNTEHSEPLYTTDILFIPSPIEIWGNSIRQTLTNNEYQTAGLTTSTLSSKVDTWGVPLPLYNNLKTDRKYNKQYPYFASLSETVPQLITNYDNTVSDIHYDAPDQSSKYNILLRGNCGYGMLMCHRHYNTISKKIEWTIIEDAIHSSGVINPCFSIG